MAQQEEKNKATQNPLASEYRAIEGAYRRDLSILEARPKIEQWGIIIWGMVDVILLIVFVIAVPAYIVSGSFTDARQAASILVNNANHHALVLAQAPVSLELGTAKALAGEVGYTDFTAEASNPNPNWYVTFNYAFTYEGGETDPMAGFLNPGETLPLTALHVKSTSAIRDAQLVIRDLTWSRVDKHVIADTAAFLAEHNEFPVSSVVSVADIVLGKSSVARTDFTVQNLTAYSYWEPRFIILLMRGGSPVAVQEATLPSFKAGETRNVSVRWFQPLPSGSTVKIVPVINYFDQAVYMNPLGE